MPNVYRFGLKKLMEHLNPLVDMGLTSILLFGVIDKLPKDDNGTSADSNSNPVIRAIPLLRQAYPNLLIACDVCLCPYTSHGIDDNSFYQQRIKPSFVFKVIAASSKMDS